MIEQAEDGGYHTGIAFINLILSEHGPLKVYNKKLPIL